MTESSEGTIQIVVLPDEPGEARERAIRNLYLREIELQAHFALFGLHRALSAADPARPSDRLPWYDLQAALSAAVVVSRLLKGDDIKGDTDARRYACERGEQLCELLQVDPESPLLSRGLRNDFEHVDQRLDDVVRDEVTILIDLFVSVETRPMLFGEDGQKFNLPMLREIAPQAGYGTFRDNVLDLFAMRSELRRIRRRVQELLNEPAPEAKRAVKVSLRLVPADRVDDNGNPLHGDPYPGDMDPDEVM